MFAIFSTISEQYCNLPFVLISIRRLSIITLVVAHPHRRGMMAEDGGNLSGTLDSRGSEGRSSPPRTFIRLNDLSGAGVGEERTEVMVEPAPPAPDGTSSAGDEASACGEESLPYPTLAPVVFFYMKQSTRPRSWCLKMVCNPYPFQKNKKISFRSPYR